VALIVEDPAARPFTIKDPVLRPGGMATVEGDRLASFAAELANVTDTPPDPAGLLNVMLPVMVLPTLREELGSDSLSPGELTLKAPLVAETRPGLVAVKVKPLPPVVTLRLVKTATP
jgi:hypothetical protein